MDRAELLADLEAKPLVETGERLVEEKQPRPAHERPGEGETLLLTAREVARRPCSSPRGARARAPRRPDPPDLRPRRPLRTTSGDERERDVLANGHVRARPSGTGTPSRGRVGRSRRGRPAPRPQQPGPRSSTVPASDPLEPRDRAQRRRLAASRGAEQGEDSSPGSGTGRSISRTADDVLPGGAERLAQALDRQHRSSLRAARRPTRSGGRAERHPAGSSSRRPTRRAHPSGRSGTATRSDAYDFRARRVRTSASETSVSATVNTASHAAQTAAALSGT